MVRAATATGERRGSSPPAGPPGSTRRLAVGLLRTLAPITVVALSVAGILAAGHAAEGRIHHRERYAVAFADISCEPPPGTERGPFLDQVQYLASQPDQLCLLDRDLAERLAEAFAQHPWVEKVKRVEVLPGRRVRVSLAYRTPVLAVRVGDQLRAADGSGILLPPSAATDGLPVFQGQAPPPAGPAGTPWGDAAVEAAARSVAVAPGR